MLFRQTKEERRRRALRVGLLLIFVGLTLILRGYAWGDAPPPTAASPKFLVSTGFTFYAVLTNAVFSYNLATPAIAQVEEDVACLKRVVFPKGTKFIGEVAVVKSLDRVNISFAAIVFPDGREMTFDGLALSPDGSAGVSGTLTKHEKSVAGRTALKTLTTAGAAALQVASPGVPSMLAGDVSQSLTDTMLQETEQVNTSIKVPERSPILIYVRQRLGGNER